MHNYHVGLYGFSFFSFWISLVLFISDYFGTHQLLCGNFLLLLLLLLFSHCVSVFFLVFNNWRRNTVMAGASFSLFWHLWSLSLSPLISNNGPHSHLSLSSLLLFSTFIHLSKHFREHYFQIYNEKHNTITITDI